MDVYEFHYLWQHRVGVELVNRQDHHNTLAILSTNVPEVPLEAGEFIVKSYSECKEIWRQMERFPGFKNTERFAMLSFNRCPIWRLVSHDIYRNEASTSVVESDVHSTSVIEVVFLRLKDIKPKRHSIDIQAANHLTAALEVFCQALCESDVFSKDKEPCECDGRKDKCLKKVGKGKWKIVSRREK